MITDKDVKKLKGVFATKEDLGKTNTSINVMAENIITIIEMVGEVSQKLDKNKRETDDILEHHERQIDRLNDKVFPQV